MNPSNQKLVHSSLNKTNIDKLSLYFSPRIQSIKSKPKKIYNELKSNKTYYLVILLLSFLYSTIILAYFVADAIWPFYQKTKFGFDLTINGMHFKFPSTSGSLLTTIFISTVGTLISSIILKLYYGKRNREKSNEDQCLFKKNSYSKTIKLVIGAASIGIICETFKSILRELNYSIKNSLSSTISMQLIVVLYALSFLLTVASRIITSYKNNTTKQLEIVDLKDFSIKKIFLSFTSFKKDFNILSSWKKCLPLFVLCGACFGITFLIQKYSDTIFKNMSKFKLTLPFKIGGNSISILDNENNVLLTMFVDCLFISLVFTIIKYLNNQEKNKSELEAKYCKRTANKIIKLNKIDEDIEKLKKISEKQVSLKDAIYHGFSFKNVKSILFQAVSITVFSNCVTAVRRSMQKFENKESLGAWALCWVILAAVFLYMTKIAIDGLEIANGKIKEPKKTCDDCLVCVDWKSLGMNNGVAAVSK
jgi:hypothetical protein